MSFKQELLAGVSAWRLLKHPFYQAWEMGEVPLDTLKTYARQYYHHVEAFPRYLSATHSRCENALARQEILKNLIDEELGAENHPELWMQFAEGLGNSRTEVKGEALRPETKLLIDTFMNVSMRSFVSGRSASPFTSVREFPRPSANCIHSSGWFSAPSSSSMRFLRISWRAKAFSQRECVALR